MTPNSQMGGYNLARPLSYLLSQARILIDHGVVELKYWKNKIK